MKSFLIEDKNLFILYSQYHGYWCPGNARNQGISSHCIDQFTHEFFGFSIKEKELISLFFRSTVIIVWYIFFNTYLFAFFYIII